MWAGVDVGGRRKGFHAAIVGEDRLCAGPVQRRTVDDVCEWLLEQRPSLVAVDSPRAPAPPGMRSRPEERELVRAVCGLRYTPAAESLEENSYYEWIRHGFELYAALDAAGLAAVECFPTASWTRFFAPRGQTPRGRWSAAALATCSLENVPPRLSQDERDAIGAALTARAHARGRSQRFGAIVVPL